MLQMQLSAFKLAIANVSTVFPVVHLKRFLATYILHN